MSGMAVMFRYNLWRRLAQGSQQETQTEGLPIDPQSLQEILSVCLFALLIVTVLARAMMLRRRGTRVIVFGKTDKSDFLLMPLVLAMVYTVLAGTFGWPLWSFLLQPFWVSSVPGWLGLGLCAAALLGLVLTLISFGVSFRVGIDEDQPDQLVTGGMFALSRNPIYVCFVVLSWGCSWFIAMERWLVRRCCLPWRSIGRFCGKRGFCRTVTGRRMRRIAAG